MLLLNALIGALATGLTMAGPTTSATPEPSNDWLPRVPAHAWKCIVLHHSATADGDVASIDAAHRRQKDAAGNPWLGIGYHFVIGNGHRMADGQIEPTFRWQQQLPGAHAGNREHNDSGIGICLIGNFDEVAPTPDQLAAARRLVTTLAQRYSIGQRQLLRHQDVHATRCPGRLFPWQEFVGQVRGQPNGS